MNLPQRGMINKILEAIRVEQDRLDAEALGKGVTRKREVVHAIAIPNAINDFVDFIIMASHGGKHILVALNNTNLSMGQMAEAIGE